MLEHTLNFPLVSRMSPKNKISNFRGAVRFFVSSFGAKSVTPMPTVSLC